MNPTLSARLRRWQQSPYWRVHPPAPWAVPLEPATALLHLPAAPAPAGLPPADSLPAGSEAADSPAVVSLAACAPTANALAAVSSAAVGLAAEALPALGAPPSAAEPVVGATAVERTAVVLATGAQETGAHETGAQAAAVQATALQATEVHATVAQATVLLVEHPGPPVLLAAPVAAPSLQANAAAATFHRTHPWPVAAGASRLSPPSQHSPLIGLLILALVTLLEGWRAIRLLIRQIHAIWVAPAAGGGRVRDGQLRPAVAVPVGGGGGGGLPRHPIHRSS